MGQTHAQGHMHKHPHPLLVLPATPGPGYTCVTFPLVEPRWAGTLGLHRPAICEWLAPLVPTMSRLGLHHVPAGGVFGALPVAGTNGT